MTVKWSHARQDRRGRPRKRYSLEVLQPDADGFEIEAVICKRALRGGLEISKVPSFEKRRLNGFSHLLRYGASAIRGNGRDLCSALNI